MTDVSQVRSASAKAARAAAGATWFSRSPEERFWSKVSFPAGGRGCWLWTGAVNEHGYGKFGAPGGAIKAHRWALERSLGRPLNGHALHSCDTPACVNPSHLREGTQADNIRDAIGRGRMKNPPISTRREWDCPQTKLSDGDVTAIRSAAATGARVTSLAAAYGVSSSLISMICSRKRRGHVT